MSALAELIPEAKSLSRVDKLRLIQLLGEDLASDVTGDIKTTSPMQFGHPIPPSPLLK